jgi:PKHD-type hydroxylase
VASAGEGISTGPDVIGELVTWKGLFSTAQLDALERLGDGLALEQAGLSGQGVNTIRKTHVAWVERTPDTEAIYCRMEEVVLQLNGSFFRFDLSGLMTLQYAVYGGPEGGYFDWHKDYGRDREGRAWEPRKVTLSLQLSDGADYDGCDLEVRAGNQIDTAPRVRGTLVAFPANVLHRVTPITRGIRKSLVIWAVGPEFR